MPTPFKLCEGQYHSADPALTPRSHLPATRTLARNTHEYRLRVLLSMDGVRCDPGSHRSADRSQTLGVKLPTPPSGQVWTTLVTAMPTGEVGARGL
jgi:hypothetical protein